MHPRFMLKSRIRIRVMVFKTKVFMPVGLFESYKKKCTILLQLSLTTINASAIGPRLTQSGKQSMDMIISYTPKTILA